MFPLWATLNLLIDVNPDYPAWMVVENLAILSI